MTALQQHLRHRNWMLLLAIAAVLVLTPSPMRAQSLTCTSGTLSDPDYPFNGVQTAVEQTVCVSSDLSYAEIENDSYEVYGNPGTLGIYGVSEEAYIMSGPDDWWAIEYDSGMQYDSTSDTGGSSIEIDMGGVQPGGFVTTSYNECMNQQYAYDTDPNQCYWDFPTQGLSVQQPNPNAPPSINFINPSYAESGSQGTLTVTGTGLVDAFGACNVSITGGISTSVSCTSATQVTVNFSIPSNTPFGAQYLTISNSNGASSAFQFMVTATLTLTTSGPSSSTYGQPVTFIATTSNDPFVGQLSEVVDFFIDGLQVSEVGSYTATATITTSSLSVGSHTITSSASWSGIPGNFISPITSNTLTQTVNQSANLIYGYTITPTGGPSGYAPNGNLLSYTDSVNGTWSMVGGYDTLNRLVSASGTSGHYQGVQINWSYDSFGNRTAEEFGGNSGVALPTSSSAPLSPSTNSASAQKRPRCG